MDTQEFKVSNVKCGGCAATIKNGLSELTGVQAVEVDVASGGVVVNGDAARSDLSAKLAELGFPEIA